MTTVENLCYAKNQALQQMLKVLDFHRQIMNLNLNIIQINLKKKKTNQTKKTQNRLWTSINVKNKI